MFVNILLLVTYKINKGERERGVGGGGGGGGGRGVNP